MDKQEPLNLSALGMDLAASLLPDWAKETSFQLPSAEVHEPATQERKGIAFRRQGGRGRTFSKTPQKSRFASRRRSETDEKSFGKEKERTYDGRPHRDSRRDLSNLHGRDREDMPEAEVPGWQISFLPDPRGVEGLAAQIRATARAYPVFELAKLVLESPRRYDVKLSPKPDAPIVSPLFQFRFDKTLWMSEADAIRHALRTAREIFYRSEQVEVEPPKGNFQCIAEVDGVLLCPPNYHEYPEKLRVLHEQKYARMPFQAFKARVRMLRDEQALEQWRQSASRREVFQPLPGEVVKASLSGESMKQGPAQRDNSPKSGSEEAGAPIAGESPDEGPANSRGVAEPLRPGEGATETVASSSEGQPTGEPKVGDVEQEASGETAVAGAGDQVAPEQPATENSSEPAITSESDLWDHFRKNFAQLSIEQVTSEILVPGTAAERFSCTEVSRAVKAARFKLTKFPLQLAQVLARDISSYGLPVFKAHKKILYVSIARPKPIDPARLGDSLRKLLELLEKNPRTPRNQLMKILFESRPIPDGSDAAAREAAVRADLAWLIREGHVVDYAMRGIQVIKAKSSDKPVTENAPGQTSRESGECPVVAEASQSQSLHAVNEPDAPAATAGSALLEEETGLTCEKGSPGETAPSPEESGESKGISSGERMARSEESANSFEMVVSLGVPTVPSGLETSVGEQKDGLLDNAGTLVEDSPIEPSAVEQRDDQHANPNPDMNPMATNALPEPSGGDLAESESSIPSASPIEDSKPASLAAEQLLSEVPASSEAQEGAEVAGGKTPGNLADTEDRASGKVPGHS